MNSYRAINCNIYDKEKPDLTLSTHVFIAFNSESLVFTSISFRDLPRLYDTIRGSFVDLSKKRLILYQLPGFIRTKARK